MNQHVKTHNFSTYFNQYINLVSDFDVISALKSTQKSSQELFDLITEEQGNCAYAPEKWSIKELFAHIIDTERIFCTRALKIARNDTTDLPGYDHDAFVIASDANNRTLCDLCNEFNLVRQSTIALFESFSPTMLKRSGLANGNALTVLSIGYIISGHQTHHLNVIEEKYL